MCGCPPHLVEAGAQAAASMSLAGPLVGAFVAAIAGGRFGQMMLRVWNRMRGAKRETKHV